MFKALSYIENDANLLLNIWGERLRYDTRETDKDLEI